jgi:hypothetical protein
MEENCSGFVAMKSSLFSRKVWAGLFAIVLMLGVTVAPLSAEAALSSRINFTISRNYDLPTNPDDDMPTVATYGRGFFKCQRSNKVTPGSVTKNFAKRYKSWGKVGVNTSVFSLKAGTFPGIELTDKGLGATVSFLQAYPSINPNGGQPWIISNDTALTQYEYRPVGKATRFNDRAYPIIKGAPRRGGLTQNDFYTETGVKSADFVVTGRAHIKNVGRVGFANGLGETTFKINCPFER